MNDRVQLNVWVSEDTDSFFRKFAERYGLNKGKAFEKMMEIVRETFEVRQCEVCESELRLGRPHCICVVCYKTAKTRFENE
jgi:hypothetical protein